jgi:hypothetical protein
MASHTLEKFSDKLFRQANKFFTVLLLQTFNLYISISNIDLFSLFYVDFKCSFFYEENESLRERGSEICIRHFEIDDFPVFFNSSIDKIEIKYEHDNNTYRYVEKNPYKAIKICKFPLLTYEESEVTHILGPKGIISCILHPTGPLDVFEKTPEIDITSLLLEYQGPLKDFHQNTDFRVKDIMHDYINQNCYIEILDANVDSYVFRYDDLIVL